MPRRGRSLRVKLTLWFVLVFSLIQAALVVTVVWFRRESIRRSLDDGLVESAKAMIDNILSIEAELKDDVVRGLVPAGAEFVLYAIRDEDGHVLAASSVALREQLPFRAWEFVPSGPVGPVFTTVGPKLARKLADGNESLRLVTLPFHYRDGLYFFQSAVRDPFWERLLGPLDLVVVGLPIGVLAAMIAAWLIGGRAVAPIHRLSRAVTGLSPLSLGKRFRTRTTDTEVARLEDELNRAMERLEAGYEAQAQFISNVSHELKTPIAVLLTEAQVAKLGRRNLETSYAFIDRAEAGLKRLGHLVESFLTLARTDLNRNRPMDSVSVNEVVLESVRHCKLVAEQQGVPLVPQLIDLDDSSDPAVTGDAELLQVMVENLVRNAVRHSPRGAPVSIEASCDADFVQIAVRDRGPGIPEEYLSKVFDRGVRIPTDGGDSDGSGLGLAIASNVAQLHGGRIALERNPSGGCSFVVTLPLASRVDGSRAKA